MKKKGNRFNGIVRLIAVLCAFVLVIQTVPVQTAVTISSYAGETSEEEKKKEEEEKKKEEEEKKKEEEEKKKKEEEEKKKEEEIGRAHV